MAKIPYKVGFRAGGGFLRILKIGLLGFFLLYLFVSIILTAINERDLDVVVKELGEEFFNPIQTAQEYSIEIKKDTSIGFLSGIWTYWGFYFNIYKIYLWLWVLMIPINLFFRETNPLIIRYGLAISIFLTIQVLFSVIYLNESPNYPFIAIKDTFDGLVHLLINTDFSSGSEEIIKSSNDCNSSICIV